MKEGKFRAEPLQTDVLTGVETKKRTFVPPLRSSRAGGVGAAPLPKWSVGLEAFGLHALLRGDL